VPDIEAGLLFHMQDGTAVGPFQQAFIVHLIQVTANGLSRHMEFFGHFIHPYGRHMAQQFDYFILPSGFFI
jgi:hypothetical protein